MNNFEKRVADTYIKEHAVSLLREADKIASESSDNISNIQSTRDNLMSIAAIQRFVYLAVKEYHNALSHILAKSGIVLPDLDTLFPDEQTHQD